MKKLNTSFGFVTFNPKKPLASGKNSTVFCGYSNSSQKVVIKKINHSTKISTSILTDNISKNLALPIEKVIDEYEIYFIIPWVEGRPINEFRKLTFENKFKLIQQLLLTIDELHELGWLHLDIKPQNILVDENLNLQIIDFNHAQPITGNYQRDSFNLAYAAPEQILGLTTAYNRTTDLFSAALVIYELLWGNTTKMHHNPEVLMNLKIALPYQPLKNIAPQFNTILSKALSKPDFKLPPSYYQLEELIEMIKKSQLNRYSTALAFYNSLTAIAPFANTESKKRWWF